MMRANFRNFHTVYYKPLKGSRIYKYFIKYVFEIFRVHACLYFITPNGHGLKSIDLVCMKKLDTKVNIIPIIAKADTINKTELSKFKSKIMSELVNNGVQIYQFPTEDDTVAPTNKGKFVFKSQSFFSDFVHI